MAQANLPDVSTKPFGEDGKALDGVRILDFTHVQSGPTCTQLLAWFGADVIKVERPGVGDITRGQLVDVKGADSLYFTMLNHNKRSITIDSKHPQGKRVLDALIKSCDVLVENFAPGALDQLLDVDAEGWRRELEAIGDYLGEFGERTPPALVAEQRRVAAALADAAAVA